MERMNWTEDLQFLKSLSLGNQRQEIRDATKAKEPRHLSIDVYVDLYSINRRFDKSYSASIYTPTGLKVPHEDSNSIAGLVENVSYKLDLYKYSVEGMINHETTLGEYTKDDLSTVSMDVHYVKSDKVDLVKVPLLSLASLSFLALLPNYESLQVEEKKSRFSRFGDSVKKPVKFARDVLNSKSYTMESITDEEFTHYIFEIISPMPS